MTNRIDTVINNKRNSVIPIGAIVPCLEGFIPEGFIECDGRILNQSEYPLLYNAIGKIINGKRWNTQCQNQKKDQRG